MSFYEHHKHMFVKENKRNCNRPNPLNFKIYFKSWKGLLATCIFAYTYEIQFSGRKYCISILF